ncbi:MAG: hypothetical protein WC581_13510, partial [Thermodesulfovibrionales bacterium]
AGSPQAGGSQAVIVRVTVPNNVSEGTISHITLNANDGAVTAGDTAAVKAVTGGFTLTVSTSAGPGGSISPESATVDYGNTTQFAIAPIDGYHIQSISGCGGEPYTAAVKKKKKKKKKLSAASEMTYTTGHIKENCTVTASFAKETFTATIHKTGGSGTITGSGISCEGNACGGSFEYGTKLVLKIKPDAGYKIKDIKINGKSIGAVTIITLKQILSNYDIVIIFEPV